MTIVKFRDCSGVEIASAESSEWVALPRGTTVHLSRDWQIAFDHVNEAFASIAHAARRAAEYISEVIDANPWLRAYVDAYHPKPPIVPLRADGLVNGASRSGRAIRAWRAGQRNG